MRGNARRLDLVAVNGAAQILSSLTENGVSRYGAQFANGDGKANTTAVYLTDEWSLTPSLRIDAGVRCEQIEFAGRSERSKTINLGLLPTPADDTVLSGSGIYDRLDRKFDHVGWTLGADYRITPQKGVFARYTSAFRLPSLGDFITNALNAAPTAFIDFCLGDRALPDVRTLQSLVDAASGLFSINHPSSPSGEICMGCGWTAANADYDRVQAIEVANGGSERARDGAEGPLSGVAFWEAC